MLIQTILSNVKYWSATTQWNSGYNFLEPDPQAPQTVSDDTKKKIEAILISLWNNGTGLAAQLLRESRIQGPLRFAQVTQLNSKVAFSVDPWIGFNPNFNSVNYYFNNMGALVQASEVLTMGHELSHLVRGTIDPNDSDTPDDAMQNAATWDSKGQTVRDQNRIAVDLGMTDNLRASYGASVLSSGAQFSNFAVNFSYTDGNKVDIVRIGDQQAEAANIQDHRARTDNSRDLIFGLSGDDEIYGGGGADWLYGGTGEDLIYGGTGNDTIWGDDRFGLSEMLPIPALAGDILYGDAGNDTIHGGADADYIYGGTGADTLNGDDGDDRLFGDSGNDRLRGGEGEDTLRGGDGKDTLEGGANIDVIYGDDGDDILLGEDGDDILFRGDGADDIYGGTGDDLIKGGTGKDLIYGFDGIDEIEGGTGDDTIFGDDGDDIIRGEDGADTVFGGTGNDLISGNASIDMLYGEDGDDSLVGGGGADKLVSGRGDNNGLFGEAGNDTLEFDLGGGTAGGGTGSDTIIVKSGSFVSAEGGQGDDVIDVREATGRVEALWYSGDGFDRVVGNPLNVEGLNSIEAWVSHLDAVGSGPTYRGLTDVRLDISIANAQIIWDVELVAQGSVGEDYPVPYYVYRGHLAVVDKTQTGLAGIDLGEVYGVSAYSDPVSFSQTYLTFKKMPQIHFTDGDFYKSGEGSSNVEIVFGDLPDATPVAPVSVARVLSSDVVSAPLLGNSAKRLVIPSEFPSNALANDNDVISEPAFGASFSGSAGMGKVVQLMRQDMASFGIQRGEGAFGVRDEARTRYDYFA